MATERVRDGGEMLRLMAPRLVPGQVVFRTLPAGEAVPVEARGTFCENEGLSVILPAAENDSQALAQITLDVASALDGVGLTAAVAVALAAEGIACNIVAAHHHDHVFVPAARAEAALAVLLAVSRDAE